MIQAQPSLDFIAPNFNPFVLNLTKLILPWYFKLTTNITKIEADNLDTFIELYQQFEAKKIRLLLAFRHPQINDPLCLAYLFWYLASRHASHKGIKFEYPIHAHFMYDRGIPLWAGDRVGWLYSNLGGISIQRGKLDLSGLKSARELLLNGNFPLAIAPEGATNGHNEIISTLEPGIAQLGFWCVNDLRKAKRQEDVLILPIGIKYHFLNSTWKAIASLLTELEEEALINDKQSLELIDDNPTKEQIEQLYQRLLGLGQVILEEMEDFYSKYYHQPLNTEELRQNNSISQRLQKLLDAVLKVAEEHFKIQPVGNLTDRCRRLEQAGWDNIYSLNDKENESISAVKKGLADHLAQEATLAMWHMRMVESFVSVTGYYVQEKPTPDRFAETLLIIWDLITRLKDGNPLQRPNLGKQQVKITIGQPISVSSYGDNYQKNHRQGINDLTKELETAFNANLEKI